MSRVISGFSFVISGNALRRQIPGLTIWILIPFLIDLLLIIYGVQLGVGLIQDLVLKATMYLFGAAEGFLYNLFYYPALILFSLAFLVLYIYFVYIVASVLASPFYAIIAEKTLFHLRPELRVERNLFQSIRLMLRMLIVSVGRGLALIILGIVLFIFSFIPGLNLLTGYFTFMLIAMDSMDYACEVMGLGLKDRFALLKNNFAEFIGMGGFVGLTVMLPGAILLVMPIAVIGATQQLTKLRVK